MRAFPIILAGGAGSRLWPLSRTGFPKQFISIDGKKTFFQNIYMHCMSFSKSMNGHSPLIVTNEECRFLALEQINEIKMESTLLLEPMGKNTAPAMTIAALYAQDFGDPILIVTPADQIIKDNENFNKAIFKAYEYAQNDALVVLGVPPLSPHTGYGYIKKNQDETIVEQFVEKPDKQTAQNYIKDGSYFWNAGIFVVKASVWLKAIEMFRQDIAAASITAWQNRTLDNCFIRFNKDIFKKIPPESIDFAVIEKLPFSSIPIKMVALNGGWTDLGSWDEVWKNTSTDNHGNFMKGDTFFLDTTNSYVNASSRMVSLIGIDNTVIVETPDVVLVADKSRTQDVKKLVNKLESEGREEILLHRKVYRPWGWYDVIDQGNNFKVKLIHVKPEGVLSLQKHNYRSEHWVVVDGVAEVTLGNKIITMTKNQSIYIPLGELHRLTNPGKGALEIVEVQIGEYLGEDDIIRIDDKYGR